MPTFLLPGFLSIQEQRALGDISQRIVLNSHPIHNSSPIVSDVEIGRDTSFSILLVK